MAGQSLPSADVTVIGHPVFDEVAFATKGQIASLGLTLGTTVRVSTEDLISMSNIFPDKKRFPGGSAPNTGSYLNAFGHRVSLIGMIGADPAGKILSDGYRETGIEVLSPVGETAKATTRCLILVAPDGEAATAIAIGATADLGASHVRYSLVPPNTRLLFVEGRVIEEVGVDPLARLFRAAAEGRAKIAFSIAGQREVRRQRTPLLETIIPLCSVLIGNEFEYREMLGEDVSDSALERLAGRRTTVVVTRGSNGVTAVEPGGQCQSSAAVSARALDTTGAGDAFAAGFVHGYLQDLDLFACMDLGSTVAAHMVQRLGSWRCSCPDLMSAVCTSG